MRLIYAQGFSKTEKEEWRAIIFNNILSAYKVILDAMEELDIEFNDKTNDVSRNFYNLLTNNPNWIKRRTGHSISV
jgi:hypothetical protein